MTWSPYNRGEDSPGCIISSKTSLAHARSIVNDKSSNIVVTHFSVGKFSIVEKNGSFNFDNLEANVENLKVPSPRSGLAQHFKIAGQR
jgi:hypothetical protein